MGYVEDLRAIVGSRPLILVGVVAIITDDKGRILLQQRREPEARWGLPGGLMELAESAEETARREVIEETGLTLGKLKLIDVLSGDDYFVRVSNGDEFYVVTIGYFTQEFAGELRVQQEEAFDLQFFDPSAFPEQMVGSHQQMIERFLAKHPLFISN